MLHWDNDQNQIIELIEAWKGPYRILLKTSDDPILLPIWLDHYLRHVDPEYIIIADNMSTDPLVLDIYASLPREVVIFQYKDVPENGFHNVIHDRVIFSRLYEALEHSCGHTLFVDTDEFLYPVEHECKKWNFGVLGDILQENVGYALATNWLYGAPESRDIAYLAPNASRLASGLAWAKPFMPTSFKRPGFRIHNVQFPQDIYATEMKSPLILLHLTEFSVEQRLSANKKKLVSRRFVEKHMSYEEIALLEFSQSDDPTVGRLIGEISRLLSTRGHPKRIYQSLPADCMRFGADGEIKYSTHSLEIMVDEFYEDFSNNLDGVFKRYGQH